MNPVILLDYYHPYAGLCNQLYLTTNHIHQAYIQNTKIYINKVNIDIFKKNRIPAEEFFDLDKTSENLKKLTGKDLILFEKPQKDFVIPKLCIYPVSSIEILSCLEFQKKYYRCVPKIPEGYYGIHFRVELDSIIHYLFSTKVYNDFMEKCNNGLISNTFLENFISLPEVNNYIEHLLSQYTEYINQIGFKKIWYISTLIGKKEIHNCLTGVLNKLCDFIQRNGGKVIKGIKYFQERELNALVDLITLRDSEKMIVFEGSSFSEGYCMKVNSVVNPNKEYRVVNGLVPKVSDELYFNC